MSRYTELGHDMGKLVDEKNAAYGASFAKAGDFLRLLFPEGIAPDRLNDALLLARIFDKLMRIATDRDAFGESPYRDIAGYGLPGAVHHEDRKPKEMSASALQPASDATTGPEKRRSGILPAQPSSPPRAVSSLKEGLEAAFAPAATAAAPSSEDDLRKRYAKAKNGSYYPEAWSERKAASVCVMCGEPMAPGHLYIWSVDQSSFNTHDFCETRLRYLAWFYGHELVLEGKC